jgi:cell division protein FtsQ
MDRYLAGRSLIGRSPVGRIARPLRIRALRRARVPLPAAAGAGAGGAGRPATVPPRAFGRGRRAARALRASVAFVWGRRRARVALICVLASLPLLAGGWLALRHSSLVAVRHVHISGVHGAEAPAIEAALLAAARHESTLDVRAGALRAAVAPFRVVRELKAVPSFPHGLHIEVVEQLPVAALLAGGQRTAVAADGVVLGPALLSSSLPSLAGALEPLPGQRLHDATLLASLAILGAAPSTLAKRVQRVYAGPEGLTIAMRNGLLVYFGDGARPHAKWLSLARVLAEQSSAGASYVDVRLPARPAAGFPAGAGPAGTASSGEQASTSESAVGALAAGLSAGTSTSTGPPPGSAAAEAAESGSGHSTEGASAPSSEASSEAPSEAPTTGG